MKKKKWTEAEKSSTIESYFKSGDSIRKYTNLIGVSRSTFYKWVNQYQTTKGSERPPSSSYAFVELVCTKDECANDKVEPFNGVEIKLPSQIVLTLPQVLPAALVSLVQEFSRAYSRH